jgi:adenylate kinase family enzyme
MQKRPRGQSAEQRTRRECEKELPMTTLAVAVPVFGPPAAGKTTLTASLGGLPGNTVFRLREHVPETILAATATSAERLGWIDDFTVVTALRGYVESVVRAGDAHTVFFDNFPGTGTQVRLFLTALRQHAPACVVYAVELVANTVVLYRRALERRVCHRCERDPIHDPRLPAEPSAEDQQRCARCNGFLHPRRGDAPRLLRARMQRYRQTADGIRQAFESAGVGVVQLDSGASPEQTVQDVTTLLITGSCLS